MIQRAKSFGDQLLAALVSLLARELGVVLSDCYNISELGTKQVCLLIATFFLIPCQLQLEVFAIQMTCGGIGSLPTVWEPIHALLAAKKSHAMSRS